MVRKRTTSIKLTVDIDGVEIPAHLRAPGKTRQFYHVRWKEHGRWKAKSTGTEVLEEAKRIGRALVRGEHIVRPTDQGRLSIERFVDIQKEHYQNRRYPEKGAKTFRKFLGVLNSLQRRFPNLRYVQEIDRAKALAYVRHYRECRKDHNFKYEIDSEDTVARETVRGHVRVLRAAWNRVRLGNPRARAGLDSAEMVTSNPWEEVLNEAPKGPGREIVQFDLAGSELESLLDEFQGRPIAESFLLVSFWGNGRIEAMCNLAWTWLDQHGYIVVPDQIAKNATGKVVRIPLRLLERLESLRKAESPFVFGGFADELRSHYRSDPRKAHHVQRILDFTPTRMMWQMQRHIRRWVGATGLVGHTHHALRKTGMELSDIGELLELEARSAEKLRTTTDNKRQHYLMRKVAKRHYLLADALHANFCAALREFPRLADRLLADPRDETPQQDLMRQIQELPPEQQAKLIQEIVGSILGSDRSAG